MKNWKHIYDNEDERDWFETSEKDSKEERLKKFRKKGKSDGDSLKKRTPRVRSTWE